MGSREAVEHFLTRPELLGTGDRALEEAPATPLLEVWAELAVVVASAVMRGLAVGAALAAVEATVRRAVRVLSSWSGKGHPRVKIWDHGGFRNSHPASYGPPRD